MSKHTCNTARTSHSRHQGCVGKHDVKESYAAKIDHGISVTYQVVSLPNELADVIFDGTRVDHLSPDHNRGFGEMRRRSTETQW